MQAILITDLYLRDPDGSPDAAAHAARIGARLDRAVEMAPDADCCILMGDLTDAGEPDAYRWLKLRLEALPCPVVPMLGNHDNRQAFREVFRIECVRGGFIQSVRQFGETRLVFLDTHDPGTDAGLLCQDRLDWLDNQLDEGGTVCLFLHHPPCDIGDPVLDPIRLSNAGELAALLRRHGNVRQIYFGHVHRTMFLSWNGIPCASLDNFGAEKAKGRAPTFGLLACDGEVLTLTVKPLT
jgi:3',5'-cyclic AMP phosphodiesterase CpdA